MRLNNTTYAVTKKYGAFLLCLLPISYYYSVLFLNIVNVPFMDDYDSSLNHMISFLDQKSLISKISLLLQPHNEHKIVTNHFLELTSYYLFGNVNFAFIIFTFNSFLIIIFLSTYYNIKKEERNHPLVILPFSIVFFSFNSWFSNLWVSAGGPMLSVLVLGYFSLLVLLKSKTSYKKIIFASILALWASLSFGSGIVVFPVGYLILLFNRRESSNIKVIIWTLSFIASGILFLVFFKQNPNHPSILKTLTDDFLNLILYFFTFIGGILSPLGRNWCLITGIVLFMIFVIIFLFRRTSSITSYTLIYLFFTALLISIARSGFGVDQAMSERYRVFSVFIFSFFLLYISDSITKKNIYIWISQITLLSIAIFLYFFRFSSSINEINERKDKLVLELSCFKSNKNLVDLSYPSQQRSRRILNQAIDQGIFSYNCISELPETILMNVPFKPNSVQNLVSGFGVKQEAYSYFIIEGWAFPKDTSINKYNTYIHLYNNENSYIINTLRYSRLDVNHYFTTYKHINQCGFAQYVNKKELDYGNYNIGVLLKGENNKFFYSKLLGESIDVLPNKITDNDFKITSAYVDKGYIEAQITFDKINTDTGQLYCILKSLETEFLFPIKQVDIKKEGEINYIRFNIKNIIKKHGNYRITFLYHDQLSLKVYSTLGFHEPVIF